MGIAIMGGDMDEYGLMKAERDKWKRLSEDKMVSARLREKARVQYERIVSEISKKFRRI